MPVGGSPSSCAELVCVRSSVRLSARSCNHRGRSSRRYRSLPCRTGIYSTRYICGTAGRAPRPEHDHGLYSLEISKKYPQGIHVLYGLSILQLPPATEPALGRKDVE